VSEADLVVELARRRASKFKHYGAMKRLGENEDDEILDQTCSMKS